MISEVFSTSSSGTTNRTKRDVLEWELNGHLEFVISRADANRPRCVFTLNLALCHLAGPSFRGMSKVWNRTQESSWQDRYLLLFISDGQVFCRHVHSKHGTRSRINVEPSQHSKPDLLYIEDAIAQYSSLSKSRLWVCCGSVIPLSMSNSYCLPGAAIFSSVGFSGETGLAKPLGR